MDERSGMAPGVSMIPPSQEVADLMAALDRAVKGVKMYPAGNPQHGLFLNRAVERFLGFFSVYPELRLVVGRTALVSGDEAVYRNDDRATSIAFVLHRDGIRELTFLGGLEDWEIRAFIRAFERDFTREYMEEDLVTVFWEQDFVHIRYKATEDFLDEFLPDHLKRAEDRDEAFRNESGVPTNGPAVIRKQIFPGRQSGGGPSGVPLLEAHLKPSFLTETEEERERVRKLVREDRTREYWPLLMETVITMLRHEKDYRAAHELFELLARILEVQVSRRKLQVAGGLLRHVGRIAQRLEDFPPAVVEEALKFIDQVESERFLREVVGGMLDQEGLDADEVAAFISAMPPGAVKGLLDLFADIGSMKVRKALCRGLADLVQEDINVITEGLEDRRWYVVRNTVFVLGMVKNPQATIYLKSAMSHKDERVRREVIKSVLALEEGDVEDYLLAGLSDSDEKLRIFTLKNITARSGERVARRVAELVAAAGAHGAEEELRQACHALGRMVDHESLSVAEGLLRRRRFFKRAASREQQWLIEGLAACGSPEARSLLGRVARDGKGTVRELCDAALRKPAGRGQRRA